MGDRLLLGICEWGYLSMEGVFNGDMSMGYL